MADGRPHFVNAAGMHLLAGAREWCARELQPPPLQLLPLQLLPLLLLLRRLLLPPMLAPPAPLPLLLLLPLASSVTLSVTRRRADDCAGPRCMKDRFDGDVATGNSPGR